MRCSGSRPPLTLVVLVMAAIPLAGLADDASVTVRFTGGRCVQAVVDRRTDRDRLWLTTQLDHGHISQAIPWDRVSSVEIGGQAFEKQVVQAAVLTIMEAAPSGPDASPPQDLIRLDSHSLHLERQSAGTHATRADRASFRAPPNVRSMSVSAWLGNWDSDIPADGLVVEILPYDSQGVPTACSGTLEFILRTGKTSPRTGRAAARSERWIRTISRDDFVSGYIVMRLPFQTIRPETSSDWWSHGALQVRLIAPGSGVIERTLTDLRLRPFEPMRDMLEQYTGDRYFPDERVQHQRRAVFGN